METITSFVIANAYTAFSPFVNVAQTTCSASNTAICTALAASFFGFAVIILLVVAVLIIAGMWKTFTKAGHPGWAAIIPIYNYIVLLQIAKKPIWWIFLIFIPFVNIIIEIIVLYNVSKLFGKDGWFTVGLFFLPVIFYPILGFGKSVYMKDEASNIAMPPTPTNVATV